MGTINQTTANINKTLDGVYGGIHVHDNAIAQSITNGSTYIKLTNWDDNDFSNNTTPDEVNGQITLDEAGDYKVECQLSMVSGTNNTIFFVSAFLDGVEQDQAHFTRKVSTSGDVGSGSLNGVIRATAGQVLDVRVRHDQVSPVNLTIQYGQLNVVRVGV